MATVLVTGGSGFIGSWCVLTLLQRGHEVRTTVRDLGREPALREQLHAAAGFDDERLAVVQADLGSDAGWPEAVAGCDFVLHVASPTLRHGVVSEADMVSTAVQGVLRVLRAARDARVRRVVLTSASGAVMYGQPPRTTPFTESDWTDVEADIPPYQRSKTLAERAAWTFVQDEGLGMELVTIQPVAVLGPVLGPDDPPSLRIVGAMLAGRPPLCPPFMMSWVDVRDVADLHVRAMTDDAAVGQRFLAATANLRVVEVARILRAQLGERAARVPTREMPLPLARLLSRVVPAMRPLRPQLGRSFMATGSKAQEVLGWAPRPIDETIAETAESLLAHAAGATG